MRKVIDSKMLLQKLGIKQIADLLGRKMEISFFHKLETRWYFVKLCFLIQSCSLDIDSTKCATIIFPWIPITDKEFVRLIVGAGGYLIQYKSPITGDKYVNREIQEFFKETPQANSLSRGKYKLL
ncbi:MAG: hypothetical protein US50_C0032G0003 [Candidatus Nomurabacteria bacterium GW2011_GWB1_37_5]|uniref:Uncharacterized protein n=1 Tax=Candidatus Nomurabacteria bacterium GW2011_GWB1_37_5 TaxID=1618742 RepID=A0A0G0JDP2_9BACT|nr:MAG: hypothetical protein US50_C0032G0003 [Candidatus Nomurabacteria bacterium GW2011_GWB1_37_5]